MRLPYFLGLFAAERGENEETPPVSRPVAEGKEKLTVRQERADFESGRLSEPLAKRSFEEVSISVGSQFKSAGTAEAGSLVTEEIVNV